MASRVRGEPAEDRPHALVLLGDQIYAHKPPESTLKFIRSRRDTNQPPGEAVADFEEYARLYRDSWADGAIRWLLSTVPSAMIFDDHEVGDDWNISESWLEEISVEPWWDTQITGAYASYWVYQHLGNLSPRELEEDDLFGKVKAAEDAWPVLKEFARAAHRSPDGTRWSFHRDFGGTRLLMIDSRGGRVLEEGRRAMVDAEEWAWIEEHATRSNTGGFEHLLLGTSLPVMLGPGMHHLQAWNERVCGGAWGKRAARWAEGIRRSQDLDQWASFHDSFAALVGLMGDVAAGKKGDPPASVIVLSGDVHHGYVAEASFRDDAARSSASSRSPVYQAVCSPLRNALPNKKSRLQGAAWKRPAALVGRLLARLAGVKKEGVSWRLTHGKPWFTNHVATLDLNGRSAKITFEEAVLDGTGEPGLKEVYAQRLS